ncbi:MAG: GNAT family N-acetyltransferase [Bacteroidia bacterium]|nr:GNAT family N-acetyltransferase [Bacteroidia bacterium]
MEIKFDKVLEGDFITLRKTQVEDAPEIYSWRTGMGGQFMRQPDNYSVQSQEEWIRNRNNNEINYIIFDNISGKKVGAIGIYEVNPVDQVSNVGRLIIADEYYGKSTPYGLEALLLTYDYVFNKMNFRKITGDILANNQAMHKLQVFLGMVQEGYLKNHVIIKGQLHDLYIMSIFKEQFNTVYSKKVRFLLQNFKKG